MKKVVGITFDYVKHSRNCSYGKRGVNKRLRALAKRNIRRGHS